MTFNLKSFLTKQASYEGLQGYWSAQSRAWCNCFKQKLEASKDKSAQKAWQTCLDEYNKDAGNTSWALKYAGGEKIKKEASGGNEESYKEEISKNISKGMPIRNAIMNAAYSFLKISEKSLREQVQWLDRNEITALLYAAGIECKESDSDDTLKEILISNIENKKIPNPF